MKYHYLHRYKEIDSQFDPQLDDTASEIFPLLSPETATMSVHATTSDNHKQKWDKRHACKFCGKLYMKIARHLEACHSTETDVEKAWSVVSNEGDYSHNYNVCKVKKGIILPNYRPSCKHGKDPTEYLPCEFCKALYNAKELNAHQNRCAARTGMKSTKRNHAVRQGKLLLPSWTCVE